MTWSYLSSDPGSSDRSWIRFRTQDNSSDDQLLQDEGLDLLLADAGKQKAAAQAARTIGAQFSRRANKEVGKLKIEQGRLAKHYFDLADELEKEFAASVTGGATGMYAGGVTRSDKRLEESDPDRVAPAFTIDQFDNPRAGSANAGERFEDC